MIIMCVSFILLRPKRSKHCDVRPFISVSCAEKFHSRDYNATTLELEVGSPIYTIYTKEIVI
jgi:hypothetical protein